MLKIPLFYGGPDLFSPRVQKTKVAPSANKNKAICDFLYKDCYVFLCSGRTKLLIASNINPNRSNWPAISFIQNTPNIHILSSFRAVSDMAFWWRKLNHKFRLKLSNFSIKFRKHLSVYKNIIDNLGLSIKIPFFLSSIGSISMRHFR